MIILVFNKSDMTQIFYAIFYVKIGGIVEILKYKLLVFTYIYHVVFIINRLKHCMDFQLDGLIIVVNQMCLFLSAFTAS